MNKLIKCNKCNGKGYLKFGMCDKCYGTGLFDENYTYNEFKIFKPKKRALLKIIIKRLKKENNLYRKQLSYYENIINKLKEDKI